MKKSISLFLLIFLAFYSFAQTTNPKLDQHRNFKEIKLGDSKQKWNSSLTKVDTKNGVDVYEFNTNTCCSKIFDLEIEALYVFIKQDKIVGIQIEPYKIQKGSSQGEPTNVNVGFSKFDNFQSKFSTLFGRPYAIESKSEGTKIKLAQWIGNNTFLELDYDYFGVMNGDRLKIEIWDLNQLKAFSSYGF